MQRERGMLGPAAGVVKAKALLLALVACLAAASGCFWRSYPERLRTHAELLVSFARKARDLVATGRFTAEDLPELTYPLERASAFAADARRRADAPPASLVAFDTLLGRYRALVDQVDRARRDPEAARTLDDTLTSIEAAARDVDEAVAGEAG